MKSPITPGSQTSLAARLTSYGGMSIAVAAAFTAKPAQAGVILSPIENLSTSSTGAVWFGFTPSTPAATNPAFSFGLYRNSFFGGNSSGRTARFEWGNNSNAKVLIGINNYAAPLNAGVFVGPGTSFLKSALIARTSSFFGSSSCCSSSSSSSGFARAKHGARRFSAPLGSPFYLGLELDGPTPLFGWAQIQIDPNTYDVNLIQFAYEDSGSGINTGDTSTVPEPSSAVLVALGAAGIAAYKRRRKAA